jgi:hypothetical protein
MPNAASHYTTGFYQVQQGTTGDCIGQNRGQLASDKMSSIYNSLTSASPQLFTYPAYVLRPFFIPVRGLSSAEPFPGLRDAYISAG